MGHYMLTLTSPKGEVLFEAPVAEALVNLSLSPVAVLQHETEPYWDALEEKWPSTTTSTP